MGRTKCAFSGKKEGSSGDDALFQELLSPDNERRNTGMKKLVIVSIVVLGLTALAASGPKFKGKIENWNDGMIDKITFVQPGPWGGVYDSIEVEPVDTSHTRILGESKAKQAAKDAVADMDKWCMTALKTAYGVKAPELMIAGNSSEGISDKRTVILKWHCVEIDPGSRSKRLLVGMGAGHNGVEIAGLLVDKASGKTILEFDHRKISGKGFAWNGGRYNKVLKNSSEWTAEDIGKMLSIVLRTKAAPYATGGKPKGK